MNDSHSIPWSWLHLLWIPLVAVVRWFNGRLDRLEEDKAARSELQQLRDDIRAWQDQQRQQHQDNTQRLDDILLALTQGARNQR